MSNLDKSIASLVKFNNGQFKSEKQAKLFLSKAVDGVYYSSGGSMYGNTFRHAYQLGPRGVEKVVKMLGKGKKKTVWTPDQTGAWKQSNENRQKRKELAAWINKAQAIYNKYEKTITKMAMNKETMHLVVPRAKRLKAFEDMIEQAREKFESLPHK
jgi:hypothetical protein